MRIVLKPLGAVAIVGAIILLSLLAFRNNALKNAVPDGTPGVTVPSTGAATVATGGGELKVYENGLENGWMERGWAKTIDYANASPVRGNKGRSIRVSAAPYEAIKIYNPVANLSSYKYLVFFLHGGNNGGQQLTVTTVANGKTQKGVALAPPPANKWVRVSVPFAQLGIEGRRDVQAFWVQTTSADTAVFHIDDIQFRATPPGEVAEETLALPEMATITITP
ncbi:MAG: hypothetical protein H8F28_12550 [Fibrella sp.]|nr:hypothetical protein [Armatimonadota bacterium]